MSFYEENNATDQTAEPIKTNETQDSPGYQLPPKVFHFKSETYGKLPALGDNPAPPLPCCCDGYLIPVSEKPLGKQIIEAHRFYRNVDRTEGRKLIENAKKGAFILRPSKESSYLAILMINGGYKIQNIPIWYNKQCGKFYLDTSTGEPVMFENIDTLLEFYSRNDIKGDKLLIDNKN